MPNVAERAVPRWLHWWAVLTVAATVVLLPLGALVTTIRAGMADPVWPTTPWYLIVYLFETPWKDVQGNYLIEHSHRFVAFLVGWMMIVMVVGAWWRAPRWVGWLSTSALLAVITQGMLGGLRVLLDQMIGPEMAAVHGVFGALVFSLLVSVAVLTNNRTGQPLDATLQRRFVRLASVVVYLTLIQLALGSLVRHTYFRSGPRLHLLGAFAVLAAVIWLARAVWECPSARRRLGRSVSVLVLFVTIQLILGVEAWLSKFANSSFLELQSPATTLPQVAVRTAHFLLGSCILAVAHTTVLLAQLAPSPVPVPDSSSPPSPAQPRPHDAGTTASATTGMNAAPRLEGTV